MSNGDITKLSRNTSEVKLFKIKLTNYYHLIPNLINYLDEIELRRAGKYHFDKDANRFIICRTLLKFILARQLNIEVSEVHIKKDENKKPYISSYESVCFNVSHSGNYGVIAISNSDIGVDVEYINYNFGFKDMLASIYSDQEITMVLNSSKSAECFYKFWTRKEAIVKATGKGINDHLPKIPAMDGTHLVDPVLLECVRDYHVLSFDIDKDYIATLATVKKDILSNNIAIYILPSSIDELQNFASHIN